MYKSFTKYFFLIIMSITALVSCTSSHEEIAVEQLSVTDSLLKKLVLDTVQSPTNLLPINFSGRVALSENQQASIFPMVSGIVSDVKVNIGDKVQKGQVLATINSAEMTGFDKDLIHAGAALKNSERGLAQAKELYKSGLISAKELEEAKNDFIVNTAELNSAKKILQLNGGNASGTYRVVSPLNGYVIEKKINNHMQLRPDYEERIFQIADLSRVWVVANIYESELGTLKEDDEAEIKILSYPDRSYKGKIERINQTIDNNSKVINARVVLNNKDLNLKPGMMANLKIMASAQVKLPSVSARGVIFDEDKNYVIVLDPVKKLRLQEIEINRKVGDVIYVSKGLQSGDRIVASKQLFLYESLKN